MHNPPHAGVVYSRHASSKSDPMRAGGSSMKTFVVVLVVLAVGAIGFFAYRTIHRRANSGKAFVARFRAIVSNRTRCDPQEHGQPGNGKQCLPLCLRVFTTGCAGWCRRSHDSSKQTGQHDSEDIPTSLRLQGWLPSGHCGLLHREQFIEQSTGGNIIGSARTSNRCKRSLNPASICSAALS